MLFGKGLPLEEAASPALGAGEEAVDAAASVITGTLASGGRLGVARAAALLIERAKDGKRVALGASRDLLLPFYDKLLAPVDPLPPRLRAQLVIEGVDLVEDLDQRAVIVTGLRVAAPAPFSSTSLGRQMAGPSRSAVLCRKQKARGSVVSVLMRACAYLPNRRDGARVRCDAMRDAAMQSTTGDG